MNKYTKIVCGLAAAAILSAGLATPVSAQDNITVTPVIPTNNMRLTPVVPALPRVVAPVIAIEGAVFTPNMNEHGQVTGIAVSNEGIRGSGNTPFDILSAQVVSDAIILEIALPQDTWLAPMPLDSLSVTLLHTIDGQDPFLQMDTWDDTAWFEQLNAVMSTFSVADQGFTASHNASGNLEITLHVPVGYMNLVELGHIQISAIMNEPENPADWADFDFSDFFSFLLATSDFGVSQMGVPILFAEDFETPLDFVLHRSLSEDLRSLLQPIGMTFTQDDLTIQVVSSLAAAVAERGAVDVATIVTVQGADISADQWGHADAVLTGPTLIPEDWLSQGVGELFQLPDARVVHVDNQSNTAYFVVHHRAHLIDWSEFDENTPVQMSTPISSPETVQVNLALHQLVSGRQHHEKRISLDWMSILDEHIATFVPTAELAQHHTQTNSMIALEAFENHLKTSQDEHWQAWEVLDAYLSQAGLPAHGELNMHLGQGVYLSNLAIHDNLLWIQLQQPHHIWQGFTTPDIWVSVSNVDWHTGPENIFSVGFAQLDTASGVIHDSTIQNHVFSFEHLSDLTNLIITISNSAYTQFTDLDVRASFPLPVIAVEFETDITPIQ